LELQLVAAKILQIITYEQIQNLNYKAFTAGLIYYVGQTLENRNIFTQALIENASNYSSTAIRNKFNFLKSIIGDPKEF